MAVDDKEVKEFEEKYKSVLFQKVGEMSSKQYELISEIHNMGNHVDLENNLPNIRNYIK